MADDQTPANQTTPKPVAKRVVAAPPAFQPFAVNFKGLRASVIKQIEECAPDNANPARLSAAKSFLLAEIADMDSSIEAIEVKFESRETPTGRQFSHYTTKLF